MYYVGMGPTLMSCTEVPMGQGREGGPGKTDIP